MKPECSALISDVFSKQSASLVCQLVKAFVVVSTSGRLNAGDLSIIWHHRILKHAQRDEHTACLLKLPQLSVLFNVIQGALRASSIVSNTKMWRCY